MREIEQRIENSERLPGEATRASTRPTGIPDSYEEHIALMFDMLLLAFQTDSTRVATLLLAREGSNRSFAEIGIAEGHHDLTHHKNEARDHREGEADRPLVRAAARGIPREDGDDRRTSTASRCSTLDDALRIGNADGNRHTHENLPIVLAGGGGGAFKPGRFVKTPDVPITNLFLSMADGMGGKALESHGDSTGRFA